MSKVALDTDFDETDQEEQPIAPIAPKTVAETENETEELMAEALCIREDLKAASHTFKAYEAECKARISGIEARLLEIARRAGTTTLKTKFGTAFTQLKESFRVGNWDQILQFIKETDNFQMLEKRIGKLATKEIYTRTGTLPPGVAYVAEEEMVIRKAPSKGVVNEQY